MSPPITANGVGRQPCWFSALDKIPSLPLTTPWPWWALCSSYLVPVTKTSIPVPGVPIFSCWDKLSHNKNPDTPNQLGEQALQPVKQSLEPRSHCKRAILCRAQQKPRGNYLLWYSWPWRLSPRASRNNCRRRKASPSLASQSGLGAPFCGCGTSGNTKLFLVILNNSFICLKL